MKDHLTLGPTPCGEDCAQVGSDNYFERAKFECVVYREQLIRKFGNPPADARFIVKGFPHDFGTYYEVCILFNDDNQAEVDFAYNVESNLPENWDDAAKLLIK